VLALADCPVLCIVGAADQELLDHPPAGLEIVSLVARFGPARAREQTAALITAVTADALAAF
jgi:hypothetical protein